MASNPRTRLGSQKLEEGSNELFIEKLCDRFFERFTEKFSEMIEEKIKPLVDGISAIEASLKDNVTKFADVDKRLDSLEQYSRRNNLRIYGLSEKNGENTDDLVLQLFNGKLNLNLSLRDVDRTHRVGRAVNGRDRPLLVKFVTYRDRFDVFRRKSQLKGTSIVIKEDLTSFRAKLYQEAAKKYGRNNVWSVDGKVIVSYENQKRVITSFVDLQN